MASSISGNSHSISGSTIMAPMSTALMWAAFSYRQIAWRISQRTFSLRSRWRNPGQRPPSTA